MYCDLPNVGPESSLEALFLCYLRLPESPSWDSFFMSGEKLAISYNYIIGIHHDSVHRNFIVIVMLANGNSMRLM